MKLVCTLMPAGCYTPLLIILAFPDGCEFLLAAALGHQVQWVGSEEHCSVRLHPCDVQPEIALARDAFYVNECEPCACSFPVPHLSFPVYLLLRRMIVTKPYFVS